MATQTGNASRNQRKSEKPGRITGTVTAPRSLAVIQASESKRASRASNRLLAIGSKHNCTALNRYRKVARAATSWRLLQKAFSSHVRQPGRRRGLRPDQSARSSAAYSTQTGGSARLRSSPVIGEQQTAPCTSRFAGITPLSSEHIADAIVYAAGLTCASTSWTWSSSQRNGRTRPPRRAPGARGRTTPRRRTAPLTPECDGQATR